MLLEALEHGLALLYSLSNDTQHHNICRVWYPACPLLTVFLTLCISVLYCLTISPLVLRAGSKTRGCLSQLPAPLEACGITQPLPAIIPLPSLQHTIPAELRMYSLPPHISPAHTVVHVVTQRLSINTPSMKKSCVQCHRSQPLRGFLQQYFIVLLSDTSYSRLGKQQKRQRTCCSAGTRSMHTLKSSLLHVWDKIHIPPSYSPCMGEITSVYCELSTSAKTEESGPIFVRWSITCLTYSCFSFKLTWKTG